MAFFCPDRTTSGLPGSRETFERYLCPICLRTRLTVRSGTVSKDRTADIIELRFAGLNISTEATLLLDSRRQRHSPDAVHVYDPIAANFHPLQSLLSNQETHMLRGVLQSFRRLVDSEKVGNSLLIR